MAKLLSPARFWILAGLALAAAALLLPPACRGQRVLPRAVFASKKRVAAAEPEHVRATQQPSATIAATPLGFSSPNSNYLGFRYAFVSVDFLDEDRLLFTFRVPGLIHRTERTDDTEEERKVRAMVLHLPDGAVESETVWTLHDRGRYLYPLGNGEFLLRDRDTLRLGDASLQLKPYLQFPGPVLWVEADPSGKYLVTGSSEPPTSASKPNDVESPASAQASVVSDTPAAQGHPDMIVRILRRDDGKVMLVSHVNSAVHLPINSEGYLELLRGEKMTWKVSFDYFTGGNTIVGSVDSACMPMLDFLSAREFLATACGSEGDPKLEAMGLNGKQLWQNPSVGPSVWPLLVTNTTGTRLARESLIMNRVVNPMAPIEPDGVKGQDVQIIDAATGKVTLRAAASPALDLGGNVAISPSGKRVVILMDGNLQVFDLAAPAVVPDLGAK